MNKQTLITIMAVILVGVVAYKIGQSHPQAAASGGGSGSRGTGAAGAFGGSGRGGARSGIGSAAGEGFATGDVLSIDDTSMTVRLRDSGSKVVFLSASSTRITKTVEGSRADLAPGSHVTVSGSSNSDGSLSGLSVQIRQGQN